MSAPDESPAVAGAGLPPRAPAGPHRATRQVATLFAAFAFGYFLSALLRAVVATLAPAFGAEFALGAAELGLLAGAYFLGFALMQLPLGAGLDRFGPRRVLLTLMGIAVLGCGGFALARSFGELLLARLLIGIGVAAGLMAPLTAFIRLVGPATQLRLNSWMLMTGSLGMVASTIPVQALVPLVGWRGVFVAIAALLLLAMVAIGSLTPVLPTTAAGRTDAGYAAIVRHPAFVCAWPFGFFAYGGLIAMQSLWIGPWLTQVVGESPSGAARGLFVVNVTMLLSFLGWGIVMPKLVRSRLAAPELIRFGWPLGAALLALVLVIGPDAGAWWWAAWCVATSGVTLLQPAVAQAFAADRAGRALSAFNLVIFLGVFVNQWGLGLAIDALAATGWSVPDRFRAAFGGLWLGIVGSGLWYWHRSGHRLLRPAAERLATQRR